MGNRDVFRVSTAPTDRAIYRHRLNLWTSMPGPAGGHFGKIVGLQQTNGTIIPDTYWVMQTSGNPRFNQWYGFGKGESIYYEVMGDSFTEENYVATLETEVVTPDYLGSFREGLITISTVARNLATNPDTDLWVYDSDFNAIPDYGNDRSNASPPYANNAELTRSFAPGTYYLALSNYNVANNLPSPADDGYRNGPVLDFPDAIVNTSLSPSDLRFGVVAGVFRSEFTAFKPGSFGIYWARFDVHPVPEPGTIAAVGLGLATLILRRRRP
ncbi:MAG TPA: PEP-CTERM sorting domain-containing protein [Fimbriimonadaceae bacterium]|nr:PEP-CTERM sorting domain-containing protein [Fimbriimonadaceae bacterium]